MLRVIGIVAAASIAIVASSGSAQEAEPKLFLQYSDDLHYIKVDREGTTCLLSFVNETDQTGLNLIVGRTIITNQLSLFAADTIGKHGDEFELTRRTLDGFAKSRATFSKKSPQPGFYQYSSSLNQLRFDFDDLQETGGFLLTELDRKAPAVFVGFEGEQRDRAVAAMAECVDSLPAHWSLDD